jgi:hypothetical protein
MSTAVTTAMIAVLATMLAACTRGDGPPAPDWQRVESPSGFSFYVPPDAKATAAQGIDSEVRQFAAPSWRLVVDYGPYGGLPRNAGDFTSYTRDSSRIGDRRTLTMRAERPGPAEWPHVAAVQFAPDEATGRSDAPRPAPSVLLMSAECRTLAACDTARMVFQTVRFK